MTDKQRVVVSVAGGLVLVVLAMWWNQRATVSGGWFSYSPDGGTVYSGEPSTGRAAVVWLGAIAVWAGGSLWLFRKRPSP